MTLQQEPELILAIVGNAGGTNVGESLRRAAISVGYPVLFFDAREAWGESRVLRAFTWRFADRKPPLLERVAAKVVSGCAKTRPQLLIATGAAPLTQEALRKLRALGVICINYSTDDPWNPAQIASWHLRALPAYDIVFTPRRANIADLNRLGCASVHFLPFGTIIPCSPRPKSLWVPPSTTCSSSRGRPGASGIHAGLHESRSRAGAGRRLLGTVPGNPPLRPRA